MTYEDDTIWRILEDEAELERIRRETTILHGRVESFPRD